MNKEYKTSALEPLQVIEKRVELNCPCCGCSNHLFFAVPSDRINSQQVFEYQESLIKQMKERKPLYLYITQIPRSEYFQSVTIRILNWSDIHNCYMDTSPDGRVESLLYNTRRLAGIIRGEELKHGIGIQMIHVFGIAI